MQNIVLVTQYAVATALSV